MDKRIKALIMVPPVGASRAEQWVAGGRNAAAIDLINLLRTLESELEIHMLVGGGVDLIHFAELSVIPVIGRSAAVAQRLTVGVNIKGVLRAKAMRDAGFRTRSKNHADRVFP